MNDTELDDLLDRWTVPPIRASLRESMHAEFAARHEGNWVREPRTRRHRFAAAILCAAVLLLVIAKAHPVAPVRVPYIVDSEFVRYANDGSSAIEMHTKSYELNGAEILISRSIAGDPVRSMLGRTLDTAIPIWSRVVARMTVDAPTLDRVRQAAHRTVGAITGCAASCLVLEHHGFARAAGADAPTACLDGTTVDHETILNYATTGVQPRMGGSVRMTWWMSPELGCFALRITTEERQPDGTWRLVREKRAVHVKPNP
jgi:hypothetical protein